MAAERVCAVVVTRERPALLRGALAGLRAQTRPPDHVLVVDNASRDETPEMLRTEFPGAEVLRLDRNEGGAGGFHAGMRHAHAHGHDWLWLMDDDTAPEPEALARLLRAATAVADAEGQPPPVLASHVVWDDGRPHPMNRPKPRADGLGADAAAHLGLIPIRSATFVSLLVHRRAIDAHGLPHRHFFIWSDDVEWTSRVLRDAPGFLVEESVAHHRTTAPHSHLDAHPERFYYAVRNGLWTARGPALAPPERARHVAGVAWATGRYLARRRFTPGALRWVARGARDGLRAPDRARPPDEGR